LHAALAPSTCAKSVQSLLHAPQLCTSLDTSTQAPAQLLWPLAHPHALHWQSAEQVCTPLAPHACVALGWHTPWPAHIDQLAHVPLLHVRVCIPHSPHGWLDGPVHD
jgi:hypothetical protein